MPRLVAIDLPASAAFVSMLQRVWDDGNVAFPVDRRLPPLARADLFDAIAPDRVIDEQGDHRYVAGSDEPKRSCELESGDALVVVTSGTTGTPKGVVLSHAAVAASAEATSRALGLTADDCWLACLPLAHVGGLSVVTRALAQGNRLVVHDGFDAYRVEHAARNGATAVSLVATALQRIDPSVFRVIVVGGSRQPAERPPNVVATYGLTETGSGVVYDGVPLDGVEVQVDAQGQILVRGPMLLRCYRDGSTPLDRDGWLHTGDLGRWLPDGRLSVDGRSGDLIITGGENVWPEHVEGVLRDHPQVADVVIGGIADAEWGQRIVAWIVPRGPDTPTLAVVREWLGERLPAFMAPKQIYLIDSIPRTSLGKIMRGDLHPHD